MYRTIERTCRNRKCAEEDRERSMSTSERSRELQVNQQNRVGRGPNGVEVMTIHSERSERSKNAKRSSYVRVGDNADGQQHGIAVQVPVPPALPLQAATAADDGASGAMPR